MALPLKQSNNKINRSNRKKKMMNSCGSITTEGSSTPPSPGSENTSPEKGCTTKVTVSLLKLIERTGYRLEQVNGQRRYGGPPPNWQGPPPSKDSEVFVGRIPRYCYEDELVPVFETVGQIYELRLMMDFSGSNRGFAFVMYVSPEIADLAVQKLNDYEIREGRKIGVALYHLTEGVTDIWLYRNTGSFGPNSRQYAIVEYDSHRSAAMARRRLVPERVQLWGREIIVEWATPQSRSNKVSPFP
ncbi:hypothetical protein C0J52_00177 [Blattella germanica]|nr:hypothetical protein C0J52_00177 [Blattella germanica]